MNNRLFLLLSLLFLLASCGGQKGNVSLKVTNSFNATNTSFNGGLYLQGKKKETGEEFSFALNFGPNTPQDTVSLDLGFGNWVIRAVAWDNANPSSLNPAGPLEGEVYCASSELNFRSDTTLKLAVTKDRCLESDFSSPDFLIKDTSEIKRLLPLPIHPCGALYDPLDPPQLRSNPSPDFCSNSNYPKSFQVKPRGMKFLVNAINNSAVLSSSCIPLTENTSGVERFSHNKMIPTSIPISLVFFDSETCQEDSIIGSYRFKNGLGVVSDRELADFDAILSKNPSYYPFLALSYPLSRRGRSSLQNRIPAMLCQEPQPTGSNSQLEPSKDNTVKSLVPKTSLPPEPVAYPTTVTTDDPASTGPYSCLNLPSLDATSAEYVIDQGQSSLQISTLNCASIPNEILVPQGAGIPATFKKINCYEQGGGYRLELDVKNIAEGFYTITLYAGKTINLYIKNGVRYFEELYQILGSRNQTDLLKSFRQGGGDTLGPVSELFSPAMIGGLFWDHSCTLTSYPPMTRQVFLWDEQSKRRKTYNVTLKGIDEAGLNRLISVDEVTIPSNPVNRILLSFSCTNKKGKLLENNNEAWTVGAVTNEREERRLLVWNTNDIKNSMFEEYTLEIEKRDNVLQRQNSSFRRARKFSDNILKVESMYYNYDKLLSGSSENIHFKEFDILNEKFSVSSHPSIEVQNEAPGKIFNDFMHLSEKTKIRSGTQATTHPNVALPSGKFIKLEKDGTDSKVRYSLNGMMMDVRLNLGVVDQIAYDIRPDGSQAIITTFSETDQLLNIYSCFPSTPAQPDLAVCSSLYSQMIVAGGSSIAAIQSLRASLLNSGEAVVSMVSKNNPQYLVVVRIDTFNSASKSVDLLSQGVTHFAMTKFDDYHLLTYKNNVTNIMRLCKIQSPITCKDLDQGTISTPNPLIVPSLINNLDLTVSNGTPSLSYVTSIIVGDMKEVSFSRTGETGTSFYVIRKAERTIPNWNNMIQKTHMSMNTFFPAAGEAGVFHFTPYIRPFVTMFEINYMSLNPETMRVNVFEPPPPTAAQ